MTATVTATQQNLVFKTEWNRRAISFEYIRIRACSNKWINFLLFVCCWYTQREAPPTTIRRKEEAKSEASEVNNCQNGKWMIEPFLVYTFSGVRCIFSGFLDDAQILLHFIVECVCGSLCWLSTVHAERCKAIIWSDACWCSITWTVPISL